ncbi:MAG: cysteine methyltransferase [Lachnospiraceae bacterium]|nr:cysteine methyltransferase [Lachnospiraceae bacterium]
MDFYRRAELVCKRIPEGKVATYGQIALLCGKPGNARQVGYGLGHGLLGRNLPAHRVVNARGFMSGAASFELPDMQRLLLETEGVSVDREGIVDLKRFGWKHTMEEALALEACFKEYGI